MLAAGIAILTVSAPALGGGPLYTLKDAISGSAYVLRISVQAGKVVNVDLDGQSYGCGNEYSAAVLESVGSAYPGSTVEFSGIWNLQIGKQYVVILSKRLLHAPPGTTIIRRAPQSAACQKRLPALAMSAKPDYFAAADYQNDDPGKLILTYEDFFLKLPKSVPTNRMTCRMTTKGSRHGEDCPGFTEYWTIKWRDLKNAILALERGQDNAD